MSGAGSLQAIDDALQYFARIVAAQKNSTKPDFDRLLSAYIETRAELAKGFRDLASSVLIGASRRMSEAREEIQSQLERDFGSVVPKRLLQVRGYATVHSILLEYLALHAGEPVSASRLRMLVGDQIHTERRLRELRDLGFELDWKHVAGDDQYVLRSIQPNRRRAARAQLALNVRGDKQLSKSARASILELTKP